VTSRLAEPTGAIGRIQISRSFPFSTLPAATKLTTGAQWERLHAAIVLDQIDDQARPVIEQMKAGLKYQEGFNSDGKYRVRVTNRALNELLGTNNVVK
jgi:hypothetical protein